MEFCYDLDSFWAKFLHLISKFLRVISKFLCGCRVTPSNWGVFGGGGVAQLWSTYLHVNTFSAFLHFLRFVFSTYFHLVPPIFIFSTSLSSYFHIFHFFPFIHSFIHSIYLLISHFFRILHLFVNFCAPHTIVRPHYCYCLRLRPLLLHPFQSIQGRWNAFEHTVPAPIVAPQPNNSLSNISHFF